MYRIIYLNLAKTYINPTRTFLVNDIIKSKTLKYGDTINIAKVNDEWAIFNEYIEIPINEAININFKPTSNPNTVLVRPYFPLLIDNMKTCIEEENYFDYELEKFKKQQTILDENRYRFAKNLHVVPSNVFLL
jgi:hypothetical protein